ncbi:unnamed protein product [Rhodiola kirilowii]
MIKGVGEGTFGSVWQALNVETGEIVAIKKMKKKYHYLGRMHGFTRSEVIAKMNHPNVMKLKEVVRENDMLYFVFEYMECNLYELIKDRRTLFSESEVRNWCYQVFQGLAYMHHRGYFHRDLKPENLLVSKDILKIADLGLAREIASEPPYTDYVSTRWYRAPEVMLQSFTYGPAVDMWAMGAIMAELFTLHPLFPGSCEADEVHKICSVIGSPNLESWHEGITLARKLNYQFPQCAGVHLSTLIPSASREAIDLIKWLCTWDPSKRPSASEALQHPFFQSCYYVPPSMRSRAPITRTPPSALFGNRGDIEEKYPKRYLDCPKPSSYFSSVKPQAAVLQKLGPKTEDVNNHKFFKGSAEQMKYQPPIKVHASPALSNSFPVPAPSNSWMSGPVASDTVEKMANLNIIPGRQYNKNYRPPPLLKAGGWQGQSDPIHGQYQNVQHGRAYARKAAG